MSPKSTKDTLKINSYLSSYKQLPKGQLLDKKEFTTVPMLNVDNRKLKINERSKCLNEGTKAKNKSEYLTIKDGCGSSTKKLELSQPKDVTESNFYITRTTKNSLKKEFNFPNSGIVTPKKNIFCNSLYSPEWFHIMDKPVNQIPPEKSPTFHGTLTYLSKAQGWITVTPKHKNRNKTLEKEKIVIFNINLVEWRCKENNRTNARMDANSCDKT
jgi:hypothetical protein